MAKMGSRKHLKRYKAPKSWPIHPKEDTWTVKPAPGSHAIEDSLPLLVIIRDILGLADNSREAKRIINTGNVLIDGRAVKDYKFPVGFMDVLTIPKTEENYRILLDTKGRLTLHPISAEDAKKVVIAYEPIWAIGTGKTATPEIAQNVHKGIREFLKTFSAEVADGVRILYGGSCKPSNAAEIFAKEDVDGGLIGGAALKAEDFLAIGKGF